MFSDGCSFAIFAMTHAVDMKKSLKTLQFDISDGMRDNVAAAARTTTHSSPRDSTCMSKSDPSTSNDGPTASGAGNRGRPFYPLPLELRELIWDFALADVAPGIYFIHEQDLRNHQDAYDPDDPCRRVIMPLPTVYHLCRESREHAKRNMSLTWARAKTGERVQVPCRQFNPDIDAAYLSSKTIDRLYNSSHDPAESWPFMEIRHLALESRCLCTAQWPRVARLLSRLGNPAVLPNLQLISVILGRAWTRDEPGAGSRCDHGGGLLTPPPGEDGVEYSDKVAEELQGRFNETAPEPPFKLSKPRVGTRGPELIPGDLGSRRDIEEICWMFQDQMIPLEDDDGEEADEIERGPRLEIGPLRKKVLSAEDFRKKWPANLNFMELVIAKYW